MILQKPKNAAYIYKEVIRQDHIAWFVVGCFDGKVKDYWPAENEEIVVLQDCWFERIGTMRLPIRVITKAAIAQTSSVIDKGKVYPN